MGFWMQVQLGSLVVAATVTQLAKGNVTAMVKLFFKKAQLGVSREWGRGRVNFQKILGSSERTGRTQKSSGKPKNSWANPRSFQTRPRKVRAHAWNVSANSRSFNANWQECGHLRVRSKTPNLLRQAEPWLCSRSPGNGLPQLSKGFLWDLPREEPELRSGSAR